MSIECERVLRCTNEFATEFSIRAPYICDYGKISSTVSILTADVIFDRAIYSSIQCPCVQEYGVKVVQGIITCQECREPAPALICEQGGICNCILNTIEMQNQSMNIVVSQAPYGERVFFDLLLECASFSDFSDAYILSTPSVIQLTNFQETTIPNTMNVNTRFSGVLGFQNTPNRLFSIAYYDIDIRAQDPMSYPCCEAKTTGLRYILGASMCIALREPIPEEELIGNTKEDAEVLFGLTIGTELHELMLDYLQLLKRRL